MTEQHIEEPEAIDEGSPEETVDETEVESSTEDTEESFPRSYVEELRWRTASIVSAPGRPISTPNAYTPS